MKENTLPQIVVILDLEFSGDLTELWAQSDVCIVASEPNLRAVDQARRALEQGPAKNVIRGLTVFPWDPSSGPISGLLSGVIDVAMEHYDDYTEVNPIARIEVLGIELSPDARGPLEEWGFDEFRPSNGGFVAERNRNQEELPGCVPGFGKLGS